MKNVPPSGMFYCVWKRGKKWNGETPKVGIQDGSVVWDHKFQLHASLFSKQGSFFNGIEYKKKSISFRIFEVGRRKAVGSLRVNLADFASQVSEDDEERFEIKKQFKVNLFDGYETTLHLVVGIQRKLRKGDTITDLTDMTEGSDTCSDEIVHGSPIVEGELGFRKRPQFSKSPDSPTLLLNHQKVTSERIKRLRKTSRERRKENQSISMNDPEDTFLDNISDKLLKSPPPRVRRSGSLKLENPRNNSNDSPNIDNRSKRASLLDATAEKFEDHFKKQQKANKLNFLYHKMTQQEEAEKRKILYAELFEKEQKAFHNGIPVACSILLKSLYSWECFTNNRRDILTEVFDSLEKNASKAKEPSDLAYWLMFSCVICNVLLKEFSVSTEEEGNLKEGKVEKVISFPLMKEMSFQEIQQRLDETGNELSVTHFSFDNPASEFQDKMQGIGWIVFLRFVQSIIQELKPVLIASLFSNPQDKSKFSGSTIIAILNKYQKILIQNNFLQFPDIFSLFFEQVFSFISGFTFNNILNPNNKLCSMMKGIYLKMNITNLENWSRDTELCNRAGDKLVLLRQTCDLFVVDKTSLVSEQTRKEICPSISTKQIIQLLGAYTPDEIDPTPVSPSVLKSLPKPGDDEILHDTMDKTAFLPRMTLKLMTVLKWQAVIPQNLIPSKLIGMDEFKYLQEDHSESERM